MTRCVMGIDLGTSQVKAGLYGADGTMLALAAESVPLRQPAAGRAEQDLDGLLNAAARASKRCMADSGTAVEAVASVAIAGQMAGVGLVDRDHRPLAPYDSWLDTRCAEVAAELGRSLGERITATGGCAPTISTGPKMAWWQRHQPRTCAEAASFVTAAGYVAASAAGLRGDQAFIDPTYLHFTSVADGSADTWDAELVTAVGIEERLLPRIVASTDIVGHLTPSAAVEFGLPTGVPLAAGCGDTAASALGAGVLDPGVAFDIAGHGRGLRDLPRLVRPRPDRHPDDHESRAARTVVRAGLRRRRRPAHRLDLPRAVRARPSQARRTTGSPPLPTRPQPAAAGFSCPRISAVAWHRRPRPCEARCIGMSPITTRHDLARATLESVAFEYRRYAEVAGTADQVPYVIGMGGGARSTIWNQIKADVLGMAYRPVTGVDAGTRGAAAVAMTAIGERMPPLPDTAYGTTAHPDADSRDVYDDAYRRYRRWTDRLASAYAEEVEQ